MKISFNIYTKIVLISVAFFLAILNFALPYRFHHGNEASYLEQVEDSYEINILNLKTLQKKGVPNRVLEKLRLIKGQINKRYIYRENLVDLIGQVDFDKYKRVILNNTRRPFIVLTLLKKHQPVFFVCLHVTKVIWGHFSDDYNSMLAFNASLCSSITMIFMALIVYLLTSNKYLCYSSLVLYSISIWFISCHIFYSEVLAGMFGTASTYFLILAYIKKKNDYLVVAGVLATLLLLSSISSIPVIAVQIIALCVLFYGQPEVHKKVLIFIVTMYVTMSPLFGTFIYQFELYLYNKVFFVCCLILLSMYLITFLPFKKILTFLPSLNGHSTLLRKDPEGTTFPNQKVLFVLVVVLFLYSVLMGKTGYFVIYPILIVVFCTLLDNAGILLRD